MCVWTGSDSCRCVGVSDRLVAEYEISPGRQLYHFHAKRWVQIHLYVRMCMYVYVCTNSIHPLPSRMYVCMYVLGLWSGAQDGIGGAGDGRQFWYTEYNYQSSLSPVSRYVCM